MTRATAAAGEAAAVAADGAADGAAVGGGTDATAVAHRVAASGGVTPMAAGPAAREAAARVAASGVDATGPEAAAGGTDRASRAPGSSGASDGTSNAIDIGNMTRWRWAGCRVENSGASRKRRGGRSRRRGGGRRPRAAITRTHDGACDT